MKLAYLQQGNCSVLAEVFENHDGVEVIGIIEDFKNAESSYKKSIEGFRALFERLSVKGRGNLPHKCFHKPDSNDNLYQFIKGDLRLLCFFNEKGDAVILSHYEIKKGKKLSDQALNKARKLRDQYHLDLKNRFIQIR